MAVGSMNCRYSEQNGNVSTREDHTLVYLHACLITYPCTYTIAIDLNYICRVQSHFDLMNY